MIEVNLYHATTIWNKKPDVFFWKFLKKKRKKAGSRSSKKHPQDMNMKMTVLYLQVVLCKDVS